MAPWVKFKCPKCGKVEEHRASQTVWHNHNSQQYQLKRIDDGTDENIHGTVD